MSESDEAFDELYTDPAIQLGVWADTTNVRRAPSVLTVDFVRLVPGANRRALVARVIVAPSVALDLRDQLDEAWREYTRWSMPESDR